MLIILKELKLNYHLLVSIQLQFHKGLLVGPGTGPGAARFQDYSLIITGANMTLSDPNNEISNLLVWPNPAKDFINFQISSIESGSTIVSLIDVRGRKSLSK